MGRLVKRLVKALQPPVVVASAPSVWPQAPPAPPPVTAGSVDDGTASGSRGYNATGVPATLVAGGDYHGTRSGGSGGATRTGPHPVAASDATRSALAAPAVAPMPVVDGYRAAPAASYGAPPHAATTAAARPPPNASMVVPPAPYEFPPVEAADATRLPANATAAAAPAWPVPSASTVVPPAPYAFPTTGDADATQLPAHTTAAAAHIAPALSAPNASTVVPPAPYAFPTAGDADATRLPAHTTAAAAHIAPALPPPNASTVVPPASRGFPLVGAADAMQQPANAAVALALTAKGTPQVPVYYAAAAALTEAGMAPAGQGPAASTAASTTRVRRPSSGMATAMQAVLGPGGSTLAGGATAATLGKIAMAGGSGALRGIGNHMGRRIAGGAVRRLGHFISMPEPEDPGETSTHEAVSSLQLDQEGGDPTGGAAPLLELEQSGAEACGGDMVAAGMEQVDPEASAMGGLEGIVEECEGVEGVFSSAADFVSALME